MIILLLTFIFLLLYYLFFIISISKGMKSIQRSERSTVKSEFVSIIIPYRNEEENILKNLKSISNQKFPSNQYEVIYVDDNSEDNSTNIINSGKGINTKVLRSPYSIAERAHKKKALLHAIDQANGEIIITTDADCYHGNLWLSEMVNCFDENTGFVSGPVKFDKDSKIFERLQQLEFSSLILVGAGLIGIKSPIICNAANLGFRKSVFTAVGGYSDNLDVSSGDDEFLMQKIAHDTDYKVKFCLSKNAISYTNPNESLFQFYQQRKRWASKGFLYKDIRIIFKLVLIFLFYSSIPIQIMLGIVYDNIFLISALGSFTLKFIYEYKFISTYSETLFNKPKFSLFFIAEILHIPYIIIAGLSGLFGNYEWKGRKIQR